MLCSHCPIVCCVPSCIPSFLIPWYCITIASSLFSCAHGLPSNSYPFPLHDRHLVMCSKPRCRVPCGKPFHVFSGNVPSGLFTCQAILDYRRIFHLLWGIKRVEWSLASAWRHHNQVIHAKVCIIMCRRSQVPIVVIQSQSS